MGTRLHHADPTTLFDLDALQRAGELSRSPRDVLSLLRLADTLGAAHFGGPLSRAEAALLRAARMAPAPAAREVQTIRSAIAAGSDPLGMAFSRLRAPEDRRRMGAFLTPPEIVRPMVRWVLNQQPARVVDPGAGSGRFAAEVLRSGRDVQIVAVDLDPVASLLCRAHLAQLGGQVRVLNADYTRLRLDPVRGRTAFVGNPPYVRHHDLKPRLKRWALEASRRLGHKCSGLAGLHVYFFLATALQAAPGDVGCFITSSEWTDVRYGEFLRWLLLERLGLESLHLLEPEATAFSDAMTTAVITCFRVGPAPPEIRVRTVGNTAKFADLATNGRNEPAARFRGTRWGPIIKAPRPPSAEAHSSVAQVPATTLGALATVHRGVATGANAFFTMLPQQADRLGIREYTVPCITRASEIIASDGVVTSAERVLLVVPKGLRLEDMPRPLLEYLKYGEVLGVPQKYLCRHRSPWWYVGEPKRPPVVMTYMARRPPVFARNPRGLALLNIAHGIYPREPWGEDELDALVSYLNGQNGHYPRAGRTYHGGLVKFEPSEVEALAIPPRQTLVEMLRAGVLCR